MRVTIETKDVLELKTENGVMTSAFILSCMTRTAKVLEVLDGNLQIRFEAPTKNQGYLIHLKSICPIDHPVYTVDIDDTKALDSSILIEIDPVYLTSEYVISNYVYSSYMRFVEKRTKEFFSILEGNVYGEN